MATIDLGRLRFAWQGAWDNATVYEQNDVVTYNDSLYVGIASTITANTLPTDTNSWALMIDVAGFATSSDITTVTNSIATKAPLAQTLNAQSSNYTLQSSDNGAVIKASGTITITVPDAVFSAGERVDIVNTGTGVITIAAGAGVTLLSKDSAVTIDTQYAAASIIFDTASQAFLIGDIA